MKVENNEGIINVERLSVKTVEAMRSLYALIPRCKEIVARIDLDAPCPAIYAKDQHELLALLFAIELSYEALNRDLGYKNGQYVSIGENMLYDMDLDLLVELDLYHEKLEELANSADHVRRYRAKKRIEEQDVL